MLTLVTERTHRFFWWLSVAIVLCHRRCGRLPGSRIILIGLLIIGPCCALFSARRVSVAQIGGLAVGLALLSPLPTESGSPRLQFAFTSAVLLVAIACTWAAGIIESIAGR